MPPAEIESRLKGMFSKSRLLAFVAAGLMAVTGFGQTTVPQNPRSATLRRILTRGYLGVGVVDLTDDRVKALKLKDSNGVEVKLVDPNSPASRAGLKPNDVILEINGKAVTDIDQFQTTIAESQPGSKVNLTVWRDASKQTITATLFGRPENPFTGVEPPNPAAPPLPAFPQLYPFQPFPTNAPMIGFEGESLSGQLADFFGVKTGVLVREVRAGLPAERAGLKAGDVVTKVDGTPVTSPREITGIIRTSGKKTAALTVVRNKKEVTINVEVSEDRPAPSERQVL